MKKYKRRCSLKRSGRRIYGEAIYPFNLPDRTARKIKNDIEIRVH